MVRKTKDDWKAWHEERERYANRQTEGLDADLKALEEHIAKLRKLAPKDGAGYPVTTALIYLAELQKELDGAKIYLGRVR